jgi:predicted SprT family Zn-dependent metalloprotease
MHDDVGEVIVHPGLDGLEAARAPRVDSMVKEFLDKYVAFFNTQQPTQVVIRNNLTSRWLGRTHYFPKTGHTAIELQRKLLNSRSNLERVIAHEVIHLVNFLKYYGGPEHKQKLGKTGHGPAFMELAEKVNAAKGENFVTEISDQSYEEMPPSKPYYMLIVPPGILAPAHVGYLWAWAARHTPKMDRVIRIVLGEGGAFITARDPRFLGGRNRIGSGQWASPHDAEVKAELERLWAVGKTARSEA